ncbi:MAG TPA: PH domain-containing protein [Baekduia sp.]|uniref:PH domain-containing protein n=1 Tax=Baekduia sp. TaxID=2600305 RepID=UPI002B878DFA|nr:PH domain-containing protein [Baekduia sp.]HMJ33853.1 PH domain-containing protein [Baekduia sp.]
MSSEPHRLHVAAAIDEAVRALADVAVPLLIGLVAGGTRSSFSAILFGLLGVGAAAAIGITRWRATTYRISDRALHFRSGVFSPDETVVPLDRVQAVDTIAGPIQRLFGVSGLQVQTPGAGEHAEVMLSALSDAQARELRAALGHPDQEEQAAHRRRRLTMAGLLVTALTAPQLGVVLPVVGGVFGLLQNGLAGESETLARSVDTVHEVVLIALALLGAAWALSFLGAVVAFSGFEIQRDDERLRIRRGLLQRRAVSVPVARVDGAQIVESALRRPFGLVTLRLEVTSLGGRETVERTLFPLLPRRDVEPFLATFLPELSGPLALQQRPPERARRRYVMRPVLAALAVSAILIGIVPAAWPAAPVLVALAVALGLDAFAAAGLRLDPDDRRVVLRARHRAARITLVARRRRLQQLGVSRTILQRRADLATVSVTVARGTRLAVRHVDPPLVDRFLVVLDPRA